MFVIAFFFLRTVWFMSIKTSKGRKLSRCMSSACDHQCEADSPMQVLVRCHICILQCFSVVASYITGHISANTIIDKLIKIHIY